MRRPLFAALIFLALGPVAGTHQRFPVEDLTQSMSARPLSLAAPARGMMRLLRGWQLESPHSRFGGFSGLARIGPDRFQLVGDNGYGVRLTLNPVSGDTRDVRIFAMPAPAGEVRRKSMMDMEAMAFDPVSGKSWVALEGLNEVWRFDADLRHIESRRRLAAANWPKNSGPEAMARLTDGRTVIFSEDASKDPRGREALIYSDDPAVPGKAPLRFFYDSAGKGLVSDAAPLPDGRVLLVHRRLGLDPIFTTIIAILDPADIGKDAVVHSQAIGRVPRALADNYEGAAISVEGARTFLWLVSDDNFNVWQRSLLLQFELVGLPPRRAQQKGGAVSGPP